MKKTVEYRINNGEIEKVTTIIEAVDKDMATSFEAQLQELLTFKILEQENLGQRRKEEDRRIQSQIDAIQAEIDSLHNPQKI